MNTAVGQFTQYIEGGQLADATAEVRGTSRDLPLLVLADHTSSLGATYDPIDDLIISIIIGSSYCSVVRDLGNGRHQFRAEPGCIEIVPPRTASYWYYEGTIQVLHISVPEKYLNNFMPNTEIDFMGALCAMAPKPMFDRVIGALAGQVWRTSAFEDKLSQAVLRQLEQTIIALLVSKHGNAAIASDKPVRRSPLAPWRLNRAVDLMAERIGEGVTLAELAGSVDLSPDHFQRAFTAATGRAPLQYFSEMRMEHAKRLLQESESNVTEISLMLGYSSLGHFSNRFRQIVGVSPKTWRETFR